MRDGAMGGNLFVLDGGRECASAHYFEAVTAALPADGDRLMAFSICTIDDKGVARLEHGVCADPIRDLALADVLTQQRLKVLEMRFSREVEEDRGG